MNDKQQQSTEQDTENLNRNTVHTNFDVLIHKVRFAGVKNLSPEVLMSAIFSNEPYSFWLDSSNHRQTPNTNNRISILGTTSAIGGRRIEYYGEDFPESERGVFLYPSPHVRDTTQIEFASRIDTDILAHLGHQLRRASTNVLIVDESAGELKTSALNDELSSALPFDFRGGFVGYLGYEVRFDTERYLKEAEMGLPRASRSRDFDSSGRSIRRGPRNPPRIPTAAFLWADRCFVYDHLEQDWYLIGVAPEECVSHRDDALRWMQCTLERLQLMTGRDDSSFSHPKTRVTFPVAFVPNRSRTTYNRNFETCLEHIRQGESYELCLTNQLEATVGPARELSPLGLYRILRRRNPAPFSAFFNWNSQADSPVGIDAQTIPGSLAIACSSPERFVSVKPQSIDQRPVEYEVEAKPIKGTCARVLPSNGRLRTLDEEAEDTRRAKTLQDSIKNRAENLMIVDLLRNDLSRVCQSGTVHVAKLMDIESFATVHQMVSTIRGRLDPSRASQADVLSACFPGGSMTGAPKLRTMELLDEIEEGVNRGPYSGCLGYISLNGSIDMNIVIRSAVLTKNEEYDAWHVSIGAGGAITSLSDNDDEYGEMMLKASAIMSAVTEWANDLQPDDSASRDQSMNATSMYTATHNLTHSFYR
jgi:para-aminobenzoate synthetase